MNLYGLGCRLSTLSGVELHDGHTAGLFLYRVSLVQQKVKRCCSVSPASVFVTFAAHRKTGKACGKNEMSAIYFCPINQNIVFVFRLDWTSEPSAAWHTAILRDQGAVSRRNISHIATSTNVALLRAACYLSLAACESNCEPSSRWTSRSYKTTIQRKLLDKDSAWK